MESNCEKCQEIIEREAVLDSRAHVLAERVLLLCAPFIKRNNIRWMKFAWWCTLPLVGMFIFRRFRMPSLEKLPEWYKEEWYKSEQKEIEQEAREIETLKAADLDHWGDETVEPMDSSDPAGYYTPRFALRRECYTRGFRAFPWEKYCNAVWKALASKEFVLCWVTRKLVPLSLCDYSADRSGVKYWSRSLMPGNQTVPKFNEWRDDNHPALKNLHRLEIERDAIRELMLQ